jgi:ribosomal protein S18 acetylase RimI-like enzyme
MKYKIEEIKPQIAQTLCQKITADLPEYFGQLEANEQYAQGMLTHISFAAKVDPDYVGLLTLELPYPQNANIYWMGVKRAYHGKGIGNALIIAASRYAVTHGANSLTVETLSLQEADENYLKTYRFYKKCGFKPLFNIKPEGYEFTMVYMHKRLSHQSIGLSSTQLNFRTLTQDDIPVIVFAFAEIGWNKPESLYHKYFEEQESNQRCVWVAFKEGTFAGYVTLKWYSEYVPFQKQNIPEISDLNVLPQFRQQGIASMLLDLAETEAHKKSVLVGIGVGLSADYGNAQKLYIKRGYVPDGKGITSHYKPVSYGSSVVLGDDLILWFIKNRG